MVLSVFLKRGVSEFVLSGGGEHIHVLVNTAALQGYVKRQTILKENRNLTSIFCRSAYLNHQLLVMLQGCFSLLLISGRDAAAFGIPPCMY